MPKIAIFTEAGSGYGYGHLSRCTALKQGFEESGATVNMYVRGDAAEKNYFQKQEWLECFEPIAGDGFDVIVVDSYHAKENIYQYAAKHSRLGVWFDDTNRINYPNGFILNGANGIILRKVFWCTKAHSKNSNRIFLSLGSSNKYFDEFKQVLDSKYEVISAIDLDEESLRSLMLGCSYAISACGQTMLELAALGIPTVGIITADNQQKNADYCLKHKHIMGVAHTPAEALAIISNNDSIIPLEVNTLGVCKNIINALNMD